MNAVRDHERHHVDGACLRPKALRPEDLGSVFQRRAALAGRLDVVTPYGVLALQRVIGNARTARMLEKERLRVHDVETRGAEQEEEPVPRSSGTTREGRTGGGLLQVSLQRPPGERLSGAVVTGQLGTGYQVGKGLVRTRPVTETGCARIFDLQRQAGNQAVTPLLAGRHGHPEQAAQREPITRRSRRDGKTSADPVRELEQVDGVWRMKLQGFAESGAVAGYIWPAGPPPGVRIVPTVVVEKPVQMGLFEITGVTTDALNTMEPGVARWFVAKGLHTVRVVPPPSPKTQYVDFDIGPVDPARPDQIQLTARPVSERAEYVDTQMKYLEYGIYLGGFNIYIDEFETQPIFISNAYVEDRAASVSAGDRIFDSLAEARESVRASTRSGDKTPHHGYFWGAGGKVIAPTIFSVATTPRIMQTLFEARKELAKQVTHDLITVAGGMLFVRFLGAVYGRATKSFTSDPQPKSGRGSAQIRTGARTEPATPKQAPDETPKQAPDKTTKQAPDKTTKITPKTPPPSPRILNRATTTSIAKLKDEGFVFEGVNADGRTAVYRNPTTGQKASVTLRHGGPGWLKPTWGRNRLEAELRSRGFRLIQETRGEGGLWYKNATTREEIRIMPRPTEVNANEPIEKHLNGNYFRFRPHKDAEWGDHTTIPDKD